MGATICVEGIIVSGSEVVSEELNFQERASGLALREQGRYVRLKLNQLKKSTHRACLELRYFADWIQYMQGFCGLSRPQIVVLYPPASASTHSNPRAPCCPHHSSFQQRTAIMKRMHRGGVCSKVHVAVKELLQYQYMKRRPPPQTAEMEQDGLKQEPR